MKPPSITSRANRRKRTWAGRIVALLAFAACLASASAAPPAQAFTDEALINGFMVTVFGAEASDGQNDATGIVKKFTGPIAYHLVSTASVDHRRTLRQFLQQLADTVQNIRFVETRSRQDAQMVIFLVNRADYAATIRTTVWQGVDTSFLEANACSAVIAARRSGIERANIYLVADEGFVALAHCMVEEIAQSLGPANDSNLLPDSIFNDMSELNVFGLFDWYILNMLYDARIRPGMTAREVRPLLPFVLQDVRRMLPHALEKSRAFAGHARR
ncbi:MAG: DUF2927 domain-containing protein [Pseudomonadota bacterium]